MNSLAIAQKETKPETIAKSCFDKLIKLTTNDMESMKKIARQVLQNRSQYVDKLMILPVKKVDDLICLLDVLIKCLHQQKKFQQYFQTKFALEQLKRLLQSRIQQKAKNVKMGQEQKLPNHQIFNITSSKQETYWITKQDYMAQTMKSQERHITSSEDERKILQINKSKDNLQSNKLKQNQHKNVDSASLISHLKYNLKVTSLGSHLASFWNLELWDIFQNKNAKTGPNYLNVNIQIIKELSFSVREEESLSLLDIQKECQNKYSQNNKSYPQQETHSKDD